MTYHGVDVVFVKVLIVGENLLGVDDAAQIGLDSESSVRSSAARDTVHVHGTFPVGLVHVEVHVEVEILQEVDISEQTGCPGRDVLTLDVGLGDVLEVTAVRACGDTEW